MPRASQNKTASVPKQNSNSWQIFATFLLLAAVVLLGRMFERVDRAQNLPISSISIDGHHLMAMIADDDQERLVGLSGRNSLPKGQALILSHAKPTSGGIWMKDMKISIDVLWVTADGKVVGLIKELRPESYPKVYYSSIPVTTVVELPAGYIEAHKIHYGSTLRFQ